MVNRNPLIMITFIIDSDCTLMLIEEPEIHLHPEIQKKLADQEAKLDAIYRSVEKTRKYFLVVLWVTVLAVVLPSIGLVFAIPSFLSTYSSYQELLK